MEKKLPTPDDFLTTTPPQRIMGSEIEYSFMPTPESDEVTKKLMYLGIQSTFGPIENMSGFLKTNGGKVYIDLSKFLEYNTQECLGPKQVVVAELAGELIVSKIVRSIRELPDFENYSADEKPFPDYRAQKRIVGFNLDENYSSAGAHENYLLSQSLFQDITYPFIKEDSMQPINYEQLRRNNKLFGPAFAAHCISRVIYTGSGGIDMTKDSDDKGQFLVSPRMHRVNRLSASDTVNNKSIINSRNESHSSEFSRLHVTNGDANMSAWAIFMKFAGMSVLLRLMENREHATIARMYPENPVTVAKKVSSDISLQYAYKSIGGKYYSAFDVQKEFLSKAIELSSNVKLPQDEQLFIKELGIVINKIESEMESLDTRVEWIRKLLKLNKVAELRGIDDWLDWRLPMYDLLWTQIPANERHITYGERSKFIFTPSYKEIHSATENPIPGTRASKRVEIMRKLDDSEIKIVNWGMVKSMDDSSYRFSNPYSAE